MSDFVILDPAKLKQTIETQNLKHWWLAEMAGIHRSTLRRWLTGQIVRVNVTRADRLRSVLGVGLADLS